VRSRGHISDSFEVTIGQVLLEGVEFVVSDGLVTNLDAIGTTESDVDSRTIKGVVKEYILDNHVTLDVLVDTGIEIHCE